ncbi:MAG TPA: VWA domain-containing protein, partial [Spirochaetia bacterium]|nr:VWA domain-containing protein [Spirochaetia bacterium]
MAKRSLLASSGVAALFALLMNAPIAVAITVSLSQLDSSSLLATQSVNAYVSVTDDAGEPVTTLPQSAFRILESPDGATFGPPRAITGFTPNAGASQGITFLLLIDNSGSMYDTLDGKPTTALQAMRVTLAKAAVRSFLASMTSPYDRVGLVAFNTNYHVLTGATTSRDRLSSLLEGITRPVP